MLRYDAVSGNGCQNHLVIFWILPVNSLAELSKLLYQLPLLHIPINKNQLVKFKANFKPLLSINISVEFGSTTHNPSIKHGYQKLHRINIHGVKHNQMTCIIKLSFGNLGSQKLKFLMTKNKTN